MSGGRVMVLLALGLTQCKGVPTSVLLHIEAATGLPAPEELRLHVFGESGVLVSERRLPSCAEACPTLRLPESVVLYPLAESGTLRILVVARRTNSTVGEGVTRVTLITGAQIEARVVVQPGLLPDRDHDGVPDTIDNCPTWPNSTQSSCAATDGQQPDARSVDRSLLPDRRSPDRRAADTRAVDKRVADKTILTPDKSTKDLWPWPSDYGSGAPFGCQSDQACFGGKCCPTPWGVKLCAPDCELAP